ncbi:hypothetical protein HanPSC8_Chr17g0789791 [Helianthus annuus]|nr:hypothetical protein HanPSC8_Chr17g0789791 [Helianthus annuus]
MWRLLTVTVICAITSLTKHKLVRITSSSAYLSSQNKSKGDTSLWHLRDFVHLRHLSSNPA